MDIPSLYHSEFNYEILLRAKQIAKTRSKSKSKSSPKPILDTPIYRRFLHTLKSKATADAYSSLITAFCQWGNIAIVDSLLTLSVKESEEKIIDYIIYLKEQKQVSWRTRRQVCVALSNFYSTNYIDLHWKVILKYLGEFSKRAKDRAYEVSDIQKLLAKADERKRVIVLTLASTGMRIGALQALKLRHLTELDAGNGIKVYKITCYEGFKEEYFTYCTPECHAVIQSYREYRQRYGEKLSPDSPLIRNQFNKNDQLRAIKGLHLNVKTIAEIVELLAVDAGLRTVQPITKDQRGRIRKDVQQVHGFRKFCNTAMIRAGVKPVVKELLLGHATGLESSYYRPEESELLAEYLKAVDLLTIDDAARMSKKNAELKTKLDDVSMLRAELERQRRDNDEFKQQMLQFLKTGKATVPLEFAMEMPDD